MLKDLTLGQYFPGNSVIHRLDARTKLLMTLFYMVLIFCIRNFSGYLLLIAFTVFVVRASEIPLRFVLKGIKPLLFFILFTAILNLFFTSSGQVLWKLGFLQITMGGVRYATLMVLRIVLLILGTSLLTYTTSPIMLTDGIELLLRPFSKIGLPAHELAMMMSIALRFIPTLLEETDKIMKAQTARGADFETGNLLARAKALVPLLVPLFISAFRRADELAVAMECRCYRGGKNRTKMTEPKLHRRDGVAVILFVLLLIFILLFNYLNLM